MNWNADLTDYGCHLGWLRTHLLGKCLQEQDDLAIICCWQVSGSSELLYIQLLRFNQISAIHHQLACLSTYSSGNVVSNAPNDCTGTLKDDLSLPLEVCV